MIGNSTRLDRYDFTEICIPVEAEYYVIEGTVLTLYRWQWRGGLFEVPERWKGMKVRFSPAGEQA